MFLFSSELSLPQVVYIPLYSSSCMKHIHDCHCEYFGRHFVNFADAFGVSYYHPGGDCVCWILCATVQYISEVYSLLPNPLYNLIRELNWRAPINIWGLLLIANFRGPHRDNLQEKCTIFLFLFFPTENKNLLTSAKILTLFDKI